MLVTVGVAKHGQHPTLQLVEDGFLVVVAAAAPKRGKVSAKEDQPGGGPGRGRDERPQGGGAPPAEGGELGGRRGGGEGRGAGGVVGEEGGADAAEEWGEEVGGEEVLGDGVGEESRGGLLVRVREGGFEV